MIIRIMKYIMAITVMVMALPIIVMIAVTLEDDIVDDIKKVRRSLNV